MLSVLNSLPILNLRTAKPFHFQERSQWDSYWYIAEQTSCNGTSLIWTSINRTAYLLNLLDRQKLFWYSHIIIINMASNSSFSSDVVGIPSTKRKRKIVSFEKSWKYVVDMKWDNCILLYQRNMVSKNRLYMTPFKVRIDWQNMQWKYNMLQDQKEALLEDPSRRVGYDSSFMVFTETGNGWNSKKKLLPNKWCFFRS